MSNGPGDPEPLISAQEVAREIIKRDLPLFGICLGHQVIALANGIALANSNAFTSGIPLANGIALANGIPIANNADGISNGTGSIILFGEAYLNTGGEMDLRPVNLITGNTAGQHGGPPAQGWPAGWPDKLPRPPGSCDPGS